MKYELYIFGSITRGEVSSTSDVDVLAITEPPLQSAFPPDWSVYSKQTIKEHFKAGRLFAWHLHLEAICVHPRSGTNFLTELGTPSRYEYAQEDLADLGLLLSESLRELKQGTPSPIYELGLVYTAIRDIAMVASWSILGRPSFSRYAPYEVTPPCPLPRSAYEAAMLARHASTRGTAEPVDIRSTLQLLQSLPVLSWVDQLRSATCQTHS